MVAQAYKRIVIGSVLGAISCLPLQAHERGHASLPAQQRYQHAIELLNSGQVQAGREILVALAKLGDRAAQFELYLAALGHPLDDFGDPAVLLRRAAGPASGQAQIKLAEAFLDGVARRPDPAMAAFWFEQAAAHGHPVAQLLLASMLQRGDGMAADPEQADFWLEQAAANGSNEAAFRLGKSQGDASGRALIERAATGGHSGAQRYLGLQLARGGAYRTDEPLALLHLTRAAESGDATAMMLVGLHHLQGRGTQINTELAYRWLKRAQVHGETRAIAQVMALEESMQLGRKVEAMTSAMAEVLPDPITLPRTEVDFPANQLLGHGAAFWINQGGYLLTNHHVIEHCTELRVTGIGIATVVVSEPQNDIAVLKLDHQPTGWAALVADQDLQIGMAVTAFTLQHPDTAFENTQAYAGTVKALARPDLDSRYFRFDARLERGSSGAPVINEQGSLVGMVVAKLAAAAAYELTGTATESVSLALRSVLIREFLDIYAIRYSESASQEMNQGQIVERLECWY